MSQETGIAWTDSTFNPWIGCTKVGPGCDGCYAEAQDSRKLVDGKTHWGPGVPRHLTGAGNWKNPVKWNKEAARTGMRHLVFCASLADVFDNEVPAQWRTKLFDLIRATPALTWQIVTKRIGKAKSMLPADWGSGYPNVWLISTIVNQAEADRDMRKLLAVPASVHGVSYEPALGPVDWTPWFAQGLSWVIVGGESAQKGHVARPFDVAWARSTIAQCQAAGAFPFVKQVGSNHTLGIKLRDRAGADLQEWPIDIQVREYPPDLKQLKSAPAVQQTCNVKAQAIDTTPPMAPSAPILTGAPVAADPGEIIEAAFVKLAADPGALFEGPVLDAFRTVSAPDYARFRHRAKASGKVSVIDLDDLTKSEDAPADNTSARLIAIAKGSCRLCHNADKQGIAIMDGEHHREVWMVREAGFTSWLSAMYFKNFKEGVPPATLKSAIGTIEAIGVHDGKQVEVHVRCAKYGDAYYIDLCDERWRAVKVDKSGYKLQLRPPVLFTRNANMRALPVPTNGAELDLLWKYANVPETQRPLVIAWALDSMRPDTPFPVLEFVGEQGSAKSSSQSILRDLIDPNKVALRSAPKTIEDIYVAAAGSWIVSYENLSVLTPNQQDALCTLSTGGGYGTRKFRTNGEEHILQAKRPVMLNSIGGVVTRADLIERTLRIDAPFIAMAERRENAELIEAWKADHPRVFGALLDRFAKVLSLLPDVQLKERHRMADFQRLGEAVLQVDGSKPGAFSQLYGQAVKEGTERALENFGAARALTSFMNTITTGEWEGTVGELYKELEPHAESERTGWPKSTRGLRDQLQRLAPSLRGQGLDVGFGGRTNSGRTVTIQCRQPIEPTAPVAAVVP